MGQRKAAKPKPGMQQPPLVPAVHLPVLQSPALDVNAAAAAAAGTPAAAEVSLSTLQQLEEKKRRLCHQLKDVEKQIFDLETRYLQGVNPNANALTGYEGLRSSLGSTKPSKASAVVPEDRIFSGSSVGNTAGR